MNSPTPQTNVASATKRWKVRVPYLWHDGNKQYLRFFIEAHSRQSAKASALQLAGKKLPVPPDVLNIKMTRV